MKKALIALAVAGVVAPVAQADNVVIYGRLNTAYQVTQTKTAAGVKTNDSTLANQSSRFGLKGEEKIGGLTAEFQIENGFDSTKGGDGLASRDTFVGLKGDFGSVRLGKNETPSWKLFDATISKFHHTGIADDTAGAGSISGIGQLGARFSKSVIYRTPDLNGFSASLQFADGQNTDVTKYDPTKASGVSAADQEAKTRPIDLSAVYSAGPITAGFALRSSTTNTAANDHGRDNIYLLAAKYKQDQFDVALGYENDNFKSADLKRNAFYVSGQFNVSANAALVGSVALAGKQKIAGVSQDDTGSTHITLGAQYDLSKRTQVYGYYTNLNNKVNAIYALTSAGGAVGTDQQGLVLGVRHNF